MILTSFDGLSISVLERFDRFSGEKLSNFAYKQVDTCVITPDEIPSNFCLKMYTYKHPGGVTDVSGRIELKNYDLNFERIEDGRKIFEMLNAEFLNETNFKENHPEYYI